MDGGGVEASEELLPVGMDVTVGGEEPGQCEKKNGGGGGEGPGGSEGWGRLGQGISCAFRRQAGSF